MKYKSKIRIFENPLLESLTHVHPITPLIVWTPIVAYLIYSSLHLSILTLLTWFFVGLLSWTLAEYILHRFMFHFPAKGRVGKYLIFLFHGLHHDDPHDPTRLVMPPVPGLLIGSGLYFLGSLLLPDAFTSIFFAGFFVGYLCYDYVHYMTHHIPPKNKVFKYLRKYHALHHYKSMDARFGVSSPLWDYIFRTHISKTSE